MVLPIKDRFHLYYSHRFLKKILVAVGENGLDFRPFAEDGVTEEKTESKAYVIGDTFYSDGGDFGYSLIRRPELKWEAAVCQPFVLFAKGKYHLFYTGKRYDPVTDGYDRSVIGHATGNNAMNWDLFSEVGIFSGFIRDNIEGNPDRDAVGRKPYEQTHLKAMDDPDFNNYFHTFFRCIGDNDCRLSRFLEEDAIIQEKGVHEIRKIYPGEHDWNVWRPCFADFAQMIFR